MDYFNSTPEEIVRDLILQNRGTQSFLFVEDLRLMGEERGLELPKNMSKPELYDLLTSVYTIEELAVKSSVGLKSWFFQTKFGISNNELRKMSKAGLIHEVGKERFRAYGQYRYASLYSVFDFCRLTPEDVKAWLLKI